MKKLKFLKEYVVLVLFLVSSLVVILISVFAVRMMMSSARMVGESSQQRMLAISRLAAGLTTGDELKQYSVPADMEKEGYAALRQKLHDFAVEMNIEFAYYMRLENERMQFIIDNVLDPDEQDGLQSDPIDREPEPDRALRGESLYTDLGNYSSGWDGLLTAYSPVYDAEGTIVAIAGVDIYDNNILQTQKTITAFAVILIVAIVVVLGSSFLCLMLYAKKAMQSESANVAKSSFLSRMSHEIRTPMNAIIGLCRMAKETDNLPEIKNHLDNLTTSSNHLLKLIDDILDLSKIESGKVELELLPIRLHTEIDKIIKIVSPQMETKCLQFHTDIDDHIPDAVYCDGTHLKQIVVNLLSNAIKFTPQQGRIDMRVRLLGIEAGRCHLEWRVRDTGIGIRSENLPKIFEPFEQEDSTTTRLFGGTGLGLSISRQLVEMMAGHIDVTSEVGKGSEFVFDIWLDIADEAAQDDDVNELAAELNVDLTGKTVLLVEDAELNQLIAENVFTEMGAAVDIADNGHAGFKKYWENSDKYDIIFMDIQMPLKDGYETTREIRGCGLPGADTIPIVAMTANVFKEDIDKALACGMNGHIGKPFEIEQIKKVITEVLKL